MDIQFKRVEIDMAATGAKLKERRMELQLEITNVAELIGVTVRSCYLYEQGNILPQLDNFINISRLYKIQMEELLILRKE